MSSKPYSAEEPARVRANQVFRRCSYNCLLIGSPTFYGLLHNFIVANFIISHDDILSYMDMMFFVMSDPSLFHLVVALEINLNLKRIII